MSEIRLRIRPARFMIVLFVFLSAGCTASVVTPSETPPAAAMGAADETAVETAPAAGVAATSAPEYEGRLPAFPGAEGFGAFTPGGRGGRVIEVTNLNDSGPGSLRAAIEAEGPRIVVFRTGGTIELANELVIGNPYITIAGQSAPGGGIAIKNSPENDHATLIIETHDVIVRYLRLRPGPSIELSHSVDALQINSGYNIIIDHCSMSWATDEVASAWYASHDISFQWNIISEGLYNSTHEEGPHSMGLILGSQGSGNVSVHHNLFAHNRARNPRVKIAEGSADVVNNVIYNPLFSEEGWGPSHVSSDYGQQRVNYVGNLVKLGNNSSTPGYYNSASEGVELYLLDNVIISADGLDLVTSGDAAVTRNPEYIGPTRHPAPGITTTDPYRAFQNVLAQAGATLPQRDPVDTRVISDVINGTGQWLDDPAEVGGWPVLESGVAPDDNDHDGMPDAWELSQGFDPANPTDGSEDKDGDGYTNVEEYLNQIVP